MRATGGRLEFREQAYPPGEHRVAGLTKIGISMQYYRNDTPKRAVTQGL